MIQRFAALLAGSKSELNSALDQIEALADTGALPAELMRPCTLRLSGLQESDVDEATIELTAGQLGTVLVVTVCASKSWALVTFASEEVGADADCASTLGSIVERVGAAELGHEAAQIYREHEKRVGTAVAAAVVAPIVEAVLCADTARVSDTEARRAYQVVGQLVWLDPMRVGVELYRGDRYLSYWGAEGNAISGFLDRLQSNAADLSREDVLLASCDAIACWVPWTPGLHEAISLAAGQDIEAMFFKLVSTLPYLPDKLSDDKAVQLFTLALDIAREYSEERTAVADIQVAGLWWLISWCVMQRPAGSEAFFTTDALAVGMATLSQTSPHEWITHRSAAGLQASAIMVAIEMAILSAPHGSSLPDLDQVMIDSGIIEAMISSLIAFELRGAKRIHEVNAGTIFWSTWQLMWMDLASPVTSSVVARLRKMAPALRFTLDHPLVWFEHAGQTTGAACAMLCALVFGKDEGGGFSFSSEFTDNAIKHIQSVLSGAVSKFVPVLPPHFLQPVVHLCISDVNKELLLQNGSSLISLLCEALLLDPQHMRKDADISEKSPVQADAVECLLQLAGFEPSKQLLQQDSVAIESLHALADGKALTQEAQQKAHSTLVAIQGIARELDPESERSEGHVMVSYQWDVQATVKKLVSSLETRHYRVWIDIHHMKGSIMESMAAGIDGADVVLYGVSLAYKESGNCRLEANYAHQQQKPMIPLMMERGFNATGWLGLLLGTSLWYPFYDLADVDDATFEAALDPLVNAIGEKGKNRRSDRHGPISSDDILEGLPPASSAAAPAAASNPGPNRRATPSPTTPLHQGLDDSSGVPPQPMSARPGFTPSVQLDSPNTSCFDLQQQVSGATVVGTASRMPSLSDLSAFMREQREHDARVRREAQVEIDRLRQEMQGLQKMLAIQPPAEVISEAELVALQQRMERLHVSKLCQDEEVWAIEDIISDYIEVKSQVGLVTGEIVQANPVVGAIKHLVALSAGLASDATFARQVKRKFL